MKNCPTCQREFTKFTDYPTILIDNVYWPSGGIKLTEGNYFRLPEDEEKKLLETANQTPDLREYLVTLKETLQKAKYRALASKELLPTKMSKDGYFTWAYLVCKAKSLDSEGVMHHNRLYLSLQEYSTDKIEVMLWTHGPNMGSAGGATLLQLGTLATIEYKGVIPEHGSK